VADNEISIPFEDEGCFDYETFKDQVPVEEYRTAIMAEIQLIKKIESPFERNV
jgi:hypothetical protein